MARGECAQSLQRVLAAGDRVTNSIVFLPGCLEEMARVRARFGTYATLDNHENWVAGLTELHAVFERYRIPLLQNDQQVIPTEQGPFAVAGIDDVRSGRPDLGAALRGLDPGIPTILLSYRPEIVPRAAAGVVAITLAGRYHGGQLKLGLPGMGLSLAHLRTPIRRGSSALGLRISMSEARSAPLSPPCAYTPRRRSRCSASADLKGRGAVRLAASFRPGAAAADGSPFEHILQPEAVNQWRPVIYRLGQPWQGRSGSPQARRSRNRLKSAFSQMAMGSWSRTLPNTRRPRPAMSAGTFT